MSMKWIGVKLNISAWRQIVTTIARQFLPDKLGFEGGDEDLGGNDDFDEDNHEGDSVGFAGWTRDTAHEERRRAAKTTEMGKQRGKRRQKWKKNKPSRPKSQMPISFDEIFDAIGFTEDERKQVLSEGMCEMSMRVIGSISGAGHASGRHLHNSVTR